MAPVTGTPTAPQLILAFDYGTRRIGVASGDTLTRTARALKTLDWTVSPPWAAIDKLIAEFRPARFVVGIPYNADGSPGALADAAQTFARELERRFKLPAAAVDERWSSLEAAERLKSDRQSGRLKRRVRREDIDANAACVILERWLMENARTTES